MKKNYTINISIPPFTFWRIFVPGLILILVVGSIAGIVIVDQVIMPRLPGIQNKGVVKVPLIVNQSYEQARQSLYHIGLRLQVQEREYNDNVPKDVVLRQEPTAESKVKRGRHIFAVLSKGSEVGTIPDVRKQSERSGRTTLREAGFSNVKIFRAYSDVYERDQIINTNPPRETATSREITVEVVVSKGSKPTHAVVPNAIGEQLSVAKLKFEEAGLAVGRIEYKNVSNMQPGNIVSQSLTPGSNVPLESRVDLVVSSSKTTE